MLADSVPLPSRLTTKLPEAVASSSAVVASTDTFPPVSPIVTVLSVIEASTVGSNETIATMPATLEPALLPPEKTAAPVPPVLTKEPPPEAVITSDDSVAFTSRLPCEKVRSALLIVALVSAVALTIATDAPTARLRPLSAPEVVEPNRELSLVRTRIEEKLPTNEPAIVHVVSSVAAFTRAPRRPVPVMPSSVASVLVVSRLIATDPEKLTVVAPAPPTAPALPLAATVPIKRAFWADTSTAKPAISARRTVASTVEVTALSATAPDSPAENFSSPAAVRIAALPVLASTIVVLVAATPSWAAVAVVTLPV